MVKDTLSLLSDKPNIFDFPDSTINQFILPEEEKETFLASVKLLVPKVKTHYTFDFAKPHIENGMKNITLVAMNDYPLPAVFNKATKKILINVKSLGKRTVSNIEVRDLYTLIVYGHIVSYFSTIARIPSSESENYANYMSSILLKIFGKKYGLIGSYQKLIPELRFLINSYVLISFFGFEKEQAFQRAAGLAKFNRKTLQIDLETYDFTQTKSFISSLSDSGTMMGMNTYMFINTMLRYFGLASVPMFEDIMRFCATMVCSSISGNTIFKPSLQYMHRELYARILEGIKKAL